MNDLIAFNFEVNKHIGDKLRKDNWSGVSPKFYRNDIKNLMKCIEISKSVHDNSFSCNLSIYSNFPSNPFKTGGGTNTFNEIFLVSLSPTELSDSAYLWELKDEEFNRDQMNKLWEAISQVGESFFNQFNSFPEPFLNIKPESFEQGEVKLFKKFEVFNQVIYMNFLKEIHLSIDQKEVATAFSKRAIDRFTKNLEGKDIANNKAYKTMIKKFLKSLEIIEK